MANEIMVSIICNVYNHEKYIRDAIDSFLMQKTTFKFEILIHDDASTDKSAEIIRSYELKYPEIIKPIYQTQNQYSQRISIGLNLQGKYVAFCEGDDYWTDPLKLQKQFDALEAHPEVDMCVHAATKVSEDTKKVLQEIAPCASNTIIPVDKVIMGEGGFVATNTIMYRAYLNNNIPRFRMNFNLDYALQIHGALRGGLLYLSDFMAVYRYMSIGSWTSKQVNSRERRTNLFERKQTMLEELNQDTQKLYDSVIQKRILYNEFYFYYNESDYKIAFNKKYRQVYMANGVIGYMKLKIKSIFPFLDGITQRWRIKHHFKRK